MPIIYSWKTVISSPVKADCDSTGNESQSTVDIPPRCLWNDDLEYQGEILQQQGNLTEFWYNS